MSFQSETLSYRRGPLTQELATSDTIAVTFGPETDDERIEAIRAEVAEEAGGVDLSLVLNMAPVPEDPEDFVGLTDSSTRLLRIDDADRSQAVLNGFLSRDEVQWAGPLVADHGRCVAYLTQEMIVQISHPAETEQVLDEAGRLGYRVLRRIPYGPPDTYHLTADTEHTRRHPGYELLRDADRLMKIEGVLAEPNLAGTAEPDGDFPRDPLTEALWDRKRIKVQSAWKKLSAADRQEDVGLAVVDGSLEASSENLRDYQRIDFRQLLSGGKDSVDLFTGTAKGHGMRVAGVAAGTGKNDVWGVAPHCPVLGLVYPVTEIDVLDMYLWLVGIDPESPRKGFPKLPPKRIVVTVCTCVGFGFAKRIPISMLAMRAFDQIAAEGRDGKGSLLFFSAGNSNGYASVERPWAAYEKNFGIAASTPGPSDRWIRAHYSNHHGVELCAPSSETVGRPASGDRRVRSFDSTTFGGTSSATPLAAGVAALVLSARPELTHGNARAILRSTAERIDPDAEDPLTVWRDELHRPARESLKDPVYSHAYGFGQVDAEKAVKTALELKRRAKRGATDTDLGKVKKTSSTSSYSFLAGSGLSVASIVLGAYHLLLAILLFWWPYADTDAMGALSVLLGLYHFVVYAVLNLKSHRFKDIPDEEDEITDQAGPRG